MELELLSGRNEGKEVNYPFYNIQAVRRLSYLGDIVVVTLGILQTGLLRRSDIPMLSVSGSLVREL